MLVLKSRQRSLLADKLLDAANLAMGGLFLAQFVTGAGFSLPVALLGFALWALFMSLGIVLAGWEAS